MSSDSHVNIGLAIANTEEIVHDLQKNTPSLLLVAGTTLAYLLISAWFFRYAESRSWSFGETLYFTALNVFSGNFQLNYEPVTALGRLIGVLNPLAGLVLFGIFIAILTMIFQPSEWSLKGKAELFGKPSSQSGNANSQLPAPSAAATDKLAKDLNDAIGKTQKKLAENETTGKNTEGLGEFAASLRAQLNELQQAQTELERAEQRLREIQRRVRTELVAIGFRLGSGRDIPINGPIEFRKQ